MIKTFVLDTIRLYQKQISPFLWMGLGGAAAGCRFYPSCSEYTRQAIEQNGVWVGLSQGFIRILKCNPFYERNI